MLPPRLRWKLDRALERLRENLASMRGGEEPRPKVCFDCGRLVGAKVSVCPNCGANQSKASFSALKRISLSILPAENPVTFALLLTNVLFMFLIYAGSQQVGAAPLDIDDRILRMLGYKHTYLILARGELWRLVMPIFLHGGLMHFGFNSFVLWQVGGQVEELFGSRRFLFIYMVTGVFGFVVSTYWSLVPSVGASGSLMGLMGVLIGYITQKPGFMREYQTALIRWALFILVLGLVIEGVDNAAHIGGLLSGLALSRIVSDRRPSTAGAHFRLGLMTWTAGLMIAASLIMVIINLPSGLNQ